MTTQALKRAVEQGGRGVLGVSAKHGPAAVRWRGSLREDTIQHARLSTLGRRGPAAAGQKRM